MPDSAPPTHLNHKSDLPNAANAIGVKDLPVDVKKPDIVRSPLTAPVTTALHVNNNNIPDSSAIIEDPIEHKPLLKLDTHNGLDKVDASQYIDPIERSLASLERSLKAEIPEDVPVRVSESSMRLEHNLVSPKPQIISDASHQNLIAELGGLTELTRVPDAIKEDMYDLPSHNGFMEKTSGEERAMLSAESLPAALAMFEPAPPAPAPATLPVAPAVFEPAPAVIAPPHLMRPALKHKDENKPLLTPKPIEDLMGLPNMITNNIMDRSKYEIEKKIDEVKNSNFAQAFKMKQEQNLKNANSWSSLAQAGSPQSVPNVGVNNQMKPKPVAMDTFQVSNIYT